MHTMNGTTADQADPPTDPPDVDALRAQLEQAQGMADGHHRAATQLRADLERHAIALVEVRSAHATQLEHLRTTHATELDEARHELALVHTALATAQADVNATTTALEDARTELERERTRRQHLEDRATTLAQQHRADLSTVGHALLAEADERGWCADYDRFVDQLNAQLHVDLPVRTRTLRVEVRCTVVVEDAPATAGSEQLAELVADQLGLDADDVDVRTWDVDQ